MNRTISRRRLLALASVCPMLSATCFAAMTKAQEEEACARIKAALFVPDPLPPLAPRSHGRFEPEPGIVAERVTYGTQYGMRVPAVLYLPNTRPRRVPALIIVDGHGGDKYCWYSFYAGILYARAGIAVLTYDPVGEGERNAQRRSGTRAHDRKIEPREMGSRMGGLMMTDVMQAVSYLLTRPEIDPGRIGAAGHSMGSFVLALAGATERRLHACVLTGGGNLDGPGESWDNDKVKPMCQGIPYQSLGSLGDRPAVIYALHASRGPTFILNGYQDGTAGLSKRREPFMEDMARRAAGLHGSRNGIFEFAFTEGGHRPYVLARQAALWLKRNLGLPNWSEAAIENLPVSRVGDWARKFGVFIDNLYATEEREAGLTALGANVPNLARDLNVLLPEDWQREKRLFVYEEWVKHALADTRRKGQAQ